MSDPQINIEIEDVLASIRRLVSEGEAPRDQPNTKVAAPKSESTASPPLDVPRKAPGVSANSPAAPEKLVLSPDQMIAVPPVAQPEVDKEKLESAPLLLTSAAPLVTPHPEDEVGGEVKAESAEIEVAAPNVENGSTSTLENEPEPGPPAEMWHSVRNGPPSEVSGPEARSQLLSTIAELEAAVTDTTDDFEPDGSEETPIVDWAETTANGAIFGARARTTRIADVAKSMPAGLDVEDAVDAPEPLVNPIPRARVKELTEAVVETETAAGAAQLLVHAGSGHEHARPV
jgi:hypothetical protein